ncbi:hypothetical protein, partial [Shewanella japonica]|uniref:hypothetical protein n=1 Tax=Shewanella japonica TaxID=93973 RepID=UPI0024943EF5
QSRGASPTPDERETTAFPFSISLAAPTKFSEKRNISMGIILTCYIVCIPLRPPSKIPNAYDGASLPLES